MTMRRNSIRIFTLVCLGACGGGADHGGELEQLVREGKLDEVLAKTQAYVDAGEESAAIYFARGWAELQRNADPAAKTAFSECMLLDDSYAPRIAQLWREAAVADAADTTRWYRRGERRMLQAYLHDRSTDLAPYADNVANLLFKEEKRFADALDVYRVLRRDTSFNFNKRKEWEFRYGRCFQMTGQIDSALTIYDGYLRKFPKDGTFDNYAAFFWMHEHKTQAEAALAENDLDAALRWALAGPREDYHVKVQGELRLLTAQIREARGEHELALADYEAIVAASESYEGEVVQSARERIEAIRSMGLR
jgi:hypothetical protein